MPSPKEVEMVRSVSDPRAGAKPGGQQHRMNVAPNAPSSRQTSTLSRMAPSISGLQPIEIVTHENALAAHGPFRVNQQP